MTDEAQVAAMVDRTVQEFGRLDIFMANASILIASEISEFPADQWRAVIDVNPGGAGEQGTIARTALESLALRYRWTLEKLEKILGRRVETLHIVGGGSQNRLLNQFTADAIGRPVVTGPVEATAAGNVLMQMLALGYIGSLEEGRELIRRSFETTTYLPRETDAWADAYTRFRTLVTNAGNP